MTVIWRDGDNVEQRERRFVSFAKGFGHYVRWNRRDLFVDPLQTEIIVDTPGPKMRRPAA